MMLPLVLSLSLAIPVAAPSRSRLSPQVDGEKPSRLAVIGQAPDFSLVTQDEKPLHLADLRGQVLLVGFIFTTCNGTCPATTHRMSQVQQALHARGLEGKVHFLSITLDPERDTPDALRRYQRLYDLNSKHWSFLTGPAAERGENNRGLGNVGPAHRQRPARSSVARVSRGRAGAFGRFTTSIS